MIIATAGHIDHGKTALVGALTGIDTDRLADEKRRGMSIDLGFAYQDAGPAGVLGFVDVPGHERFVRNMVAGVTGVDFALLVVAADDGVMPQTREHLDIVDLLGIDRGAVALSKCDLADTARIEAATAEIRAIVAGTGLDGAPLFAVSSRTGAGIAALGAHLARAAQEAETQPRRGRFRLAIDRAFTLAGVGVVVTGAVAAGSVAPGDRLVLSPSGRPVRVRGLRAQDREVGEAHAGERAAINIAGRGLDAASIRRGDWLVAPQAHAPTSRLDARLRPAAGAARVLAHWTPVHVHLGTEDVPARVAVLDGHSVAPGATGLVRLVLDRPVGALAGDRFILRDQSARHTLAGGHVIDPFPPRRGRARPQRIAVLGALDRDDDGAALTGALALSPAGIDVAGFARARNLTARQADELVTAAAAVSAGGAIIAPEHFAALKAHVVAALDAFHTARPERLGPDLATLTRLIAGRVGARLAGGLIARAVDELAGEGLVETKGPLVAAGGHAPRLGRRDAELWQRIAPLLGGGPAPPVVHEMARAIGGDAGAVANALRRAEAMGLAVRVARNRYALPETVDGLAAIACRLARDGRLTAARFRTEAGIGRNFAIEMLEHFDRAGMTQREGEGRRLVGPAADGRGRWREARA